MPVHLRVILGDQLTATLPILEEADHAHDVVLLCEVHEEATYTRHHKKKIAFLFSAMRHFAAELREAGFHVDYVTLDDPDNTGSLDGEIRRAMQRHKADQALITEPGEWRLRERFRTMAPMLKMLPDTRFLCSVVEFRQWTAGRREYRMEYFYREMRKRYGILMEADGKPVGGQWNFDKENRKPLPGNAVFPRRISFRKDAITADVLQLVDARFAAHPGTLQPFHFSVTRTQALREAHHFIAECLPYFGDYQDAMRAGEPFLFHSVLSPYLNAGLLLPLELCQMAEAAYRAGAAPLNAVEGFIRQILGWREFVRGIYWTQMPAYGKTNFLRATRPLPDFYWDGETDMACLRDTVRQTMETAHSHHIQRLMVTGNFALLAGLDVDEVCDWYLAVYADAYEWVELPNTRGMALFADGGVLGSKPYAASGKYIDRMSDFCAGCRYDPKETTGESACPFNALYWDFLARHEERLRGNPRMSYTYLTWEKMDDERRQAIRKQARAFLSSEAMRSGRYGE